MTKKQGAVVMIILLVFLSLIACQSVSSAQEYGYIKIECDEDSLPLFIDGGKVGFSPLKDSIKVPIGTHTVSLFPISAIEDAEEEMKVAKSTEAWSWLIGSGEIYSTVRKAFAKADVTVVRAATEQIFVQSNKTSRVFLPYYKVKQALKEKEEKKSRLNSCFAGIFFAGVIALILSLNN